MTEHNPSFYVKEENTSSYMVKRGCENKSSTPNTVVFLCWTFYNVNLLDYEFKVEQFKDINRLNIAATHLRITKAAVYM